MGSTKRSLTLLQINDTHGYLEPHVELFWNGAHADYRTAGGYARIRSIFERIRAERSGAVIALDNGDTFHGTFPAVDTEGEAIVAPLTLLGLDAWTAHWDFAYGPNRLHEIQRELHHPLLAINCYCKRTDMPVFPAYTVISRGGLRVGVIGIAATIVDKTMPAHFSTGIRFTLGNEELPGCIKTLREEERVDLVVVLSHLGFPQDIKLAHEVEGIDVLLSGHTHNRMEKPLFVHGTPIIQSGCHGSFVGRLDLEITNGKVTSVSHELIPVDDTIAEDAEMKAAVDAELAPFRGKLGVVVGSTETALNRNTVLEATMDNLLLDAIADAAGTEIAFSNGWRYGAPIRPGPITVNDLWNIVPPNPPVSTVKLTGAEIWQMLEANLESTMAADPYKQMGGYVKRCRALNVYFKIENPKGSRLQQIFFDGAPLDLGKTYTVAFVTTQGVPQKFGHDRRDLPIHAVDALKQYVQKNGSVNAALRGTVTAI